MRGALPEYLKGFFTCWHKSSWRLSEIACLTRLQAGMKQGIVRPEFGANQGRSVYMDDELKDVFIYRRVNWV